MVVLVTDLLVVAVVVVVRVAVDPRTHRDLAVVEIPSFGSLQALMEPEVGRTLIQHRRHRVRSWPDRLLRL